MSDGLSISGLGGGKSAKFEKIGDKFAGKILSVRREQQRDFDSGEGLVWKDGTPRLQTVVELETADGVFNLYARGGKVEIAEGEGLTMEAAIVDAVREAKHNSIDPGDELAVVQTGFAKPTKPGLNPTRLFRAAYKRSAGPSVDVADLFAS